MIILALLLAAQSESRSAAAEDFEFVTSIVVRTDKLNDHEMKSSQQYAHCVSFAYFPVGTEFTTRRDKCRKARSARRPSKALGDIFDHLDYIVAHNPGSEATLTVVKSNAPNQ